MDQFLRQAPSKIIILTDCVKITFSPQKQQPNVFEIRTKYQTIVFSAESFEDMTQWMACLQSVAFGFPIARCQQVCSEESAAVHQEENLLYISMNAPELYEVKVVETDASNRCGLSNRYNLVVTSVNISLAEESAQGQVGHILFTWPYRHIRRYGSSSSKFSFEAGRKCVSGEGLFTFQTKDGLLIFQSVAAYVNVLKVSQSELNLLGNVNRESDKVESKMSTSSENLQALSSRQKPSVINIEKTNPHKVTSKLVTIGSENEDPNIKGPRPLGPPNKPPRKSKQPNFVAVPSKETDEEEHVYDEPNSLDDEPIYDEPGDKELWSIPEHLQEDLSREEPVYAVLEDTSTLQGGKAMKTCLITDTRDLSNNPTQNLLVTKADPRSQLKRDSFGERLSSLNPKNRHVHVNLSNKSTGNYSELAFKNTTENGVKQKSLYGTRRVEYSRVITCIHKEHTGRVNLVVDKHPFQEFSGDRIPLHLMQNEPEYAQVLKNTGQVN
ncbi:docking protein 1-like isoform X2 [Limulus polyphemus]|nr:docking protein 1-like isoform X2 [Limulus polyphemus]